MRDLLLIARYEFWRTVVQRRFLFFAIGMPIVFILIALIPFGIEEVRGAPTVGYVDESGLLTNPVQPETEAELVAYPAEEVGRVALTNDEISSLWIVPADYLQSGRVRVVVEGDVDGDDRSAIRALLRANLLRDASPGVAERLQDPTNLTYFSLDSGRRVRQGVELIFALLIPLGLSLAFSLSLAYSSGFLAQAVAEEKENRLMEILATSTRVWSLIGGKVLGLGGAALSQVILWAVGLFIAALIFFLRGELPGGLPVPWDMLAWAAVFFLLAYALFATLLVGIGVMSNQTSEAQQLAGFVGVLGVVPLWFVALILENPSGTVARVLTLFPLTAPILVTVRLALGRIALPEILLSLVILLLSVGLAVWVVSRLFRVAMLHYGSRLPMRAVVAALTPGGRAG